MVFSHYFEILGRNLPPKIAQTLMKHAVSVTFWASRGPESARPAQRKSCQEHPGPAEPKKKSCHGNLGPAGPKKIMSRESGAGRPKKSMSRDPRAGQPKRKSCHGILAPASPKNHVAGILSRPAQKESCHDIGRWPRAPNAVT